MPLPDSLFREVTLRICSTLDLKTALSSCLDYLHQVMGADEILLDLFHPHRPEIERLAHIDRDDSNRPTGTIHIPPPVHQGFLDMPREVRYIPDPMRDIRARAVASYVGSEGFSEILIPLDIEEFAHGVLVIRARGLNRFSYRHAEVFNEVRQPLSIGIANILRFREVHFLKEQLKEDNAQLLNALEGERVEAVVGSDKGLATVMEQVQQVAPLNSTVLLLGETGVGKEVVANCIHNLSRRQQGPFIKVNCGAIPDSLIDSELFGHEKGAFTGAVASKRGRFERADGGTLFLDEIGELPLQAQTRLLRVLQTREIERVGGSRQVRVDFRIIAATNRNLEKMVEEGTFRKDLWYRLNSFPIRIPPLRHRRPDIPDLLNHFLESKARELGLRTVPPVAPGALEQLMDYHWPGNIRELENVVERALIRNRGRRESLDAFTLGRKEDDACASLGEMCGCVFPCLASQIRKGNLAEGREEEKGRATLPPTANLDAVIRHHIETVLGQCHGKIHGPGGAAEVLGINASTLRNRMNKLGIEYGRG